MHMPFSIWACSITLVHMFQQCGMCDQQSLRSACAYEQSDQSLYYSLEYSMTVKLLTKNHLEFQSLKGGCTGSSESKHVKMPHCWKSHATAHMLLDKYTLIYDQTIRIERGMCIKGLIWPPLQPKTENCFSPILSIGLLEV